MKNEIYKKTEKRLYDHPFLVKRVEMIERILEEVEMGSIKKTGCYIVREEKGENNNLVAADGINIEDFKRILKRELEEKKRLVFEVEKAMQCLSALEKKIIVMRYFKCGKMINISSKIGYSREYASRVKKKAVNKVGMVIWGISAEEMTGDFTQINFAY